MSYKKLSKMFKKNNLICLITVSEIVLLERISKVKILENQINNNNVYLNDFINLSLVWNNGVGFGLLSSNTAPFYNLITFIIGFIILFLIYLIVKSQFIDKFLFSIVVGGAIGNFYDRLVYAAVPDFIDIHYNSFHWFTFNIADIFITIGIIMLVIKDLLFQNEKSN